MRVQLFQSTKSGSACQRIFNNLSRFVVFAVAVLKFGQLRGRCCDHHALVRGHIHIRRGWSRRSPDSGLKRNDGICVGGFRSANRNRVLSSSGEIETTIQRPPRPTPVWTQTMAGSSSQALRHQRLSKRLIKQITINYLLYKLSLILLKSMSSD